jgi:hypothetical protein
MSGRKSNPLDSGRTDSRLSGDGDANRTRPKRISFTMRMPLKTSKRLTEASQRRGATKTRIVLHALNPLLDALLDKEPEMGRDGVAPLRSTKTEEEVWPLITRSGFDPIQSAVMEARPLAWGLREAW